MPHNNIFHSFFKYQGSANIVAPDVTEICESLASEVLQHPAEHLTLTTLEQIADSQTLMDACIIKILEDPYCDEVAQFRSPLLKHMSHPDFKARQR